MNTKSIIDTTVDNEMISSEPYNQNMAEMKALADAEVMQFNLDLLAGIPKALGSLPRIVELQPEIAKHVPSYDLKQIGKLESYAVAALYAHILHVSACDSPDKLQALNVECTQTRDTFLTDITALIKRGLINADAIREYSGQVGYRIVANDLQLLSSVLRQNWAAIEGKSGLQAAELDRADRVVVRMLRLVGLREQGPAVVQSTADMQARALTLFVNCWNQVRRAVTLVRWNEGDVDTYAPSLYGGNKRKATPSTDVIATPPAAPAQAAATAQTAAPAQGAAPAQSAAQTAAPGTPSASPIAVPHLNVPVPGSNPFMS